jgi:hypothetical protein
VQSGTIKVVYGTPIPTRGMGPEQRDALKTLVRDAIARGYDPALQKTPTSSSREHAGVRADVSAQPGARSSA